MASLDWEQSRHDGVTLVELVVTADTEEWIRIESRLEPVWPPRRQGVPAAGWDDTGFEGRVGPSDELVLGYASPAAPADPPALLRSLDERDGHDDGTGATARELIRTLGESSPPRDAVPAPDWTERGDAADGGPEKADGSDRGYDGSVGVPDGESAGDPSIAGREVEAVEPWFDRVEDRLARAERLAGIAGADEARAAIDAAGGIEAVRQLQEQLERDRRQLRQLGRRHGALSDRLGTVEIPLSTLERVT